jgi:hypothetical protein
MPIITTLEMTRSLFAQVAAQEMLGKPELGDDFTGGQVAAEALVPGGAEAAAHRTTGLRRNAQRATVVFGNEHSLDGIAVAHVEQPLDGAVGGACSVMTGRPADGRSRELVAQRLGQIAHLVEVGGAALVDPAKQLRGAKALFTQPRKKRPSPRDRNPEGGEPLPAKS